MGEAKEAGETRDTRNKGDTRRETRETMNRRVTR